MTNSQLYVRLLEELHYHHRNRSTFETRIRLQDVLIELRERAASEQGKDEQAAQDDAEEAALRKVRGSSAFA